MKKYLMVVSVVLVFSACMSGPSVQYFKMSRAEAAADTPFIYTSTGWSVLAIDDAQVNYGPTSQIYLQPGKYMLKVKYRETKQSQIVYSKEIDLPEIEVAAGKNYSLYDALAAGSVLHNMAVLPRVSEYRDVFEGQREIPDKTWRLINDKGIYFTPDSTFLIQVSGKDIVFTSVSSDQTKKITPGAKPISAFCVMGGALFVAGESPALYVYNFDNDEAQAKQTLDAKIRFLAASRSFLACVTPKEVRILDAASLRQTGSISLQDVVYVSAVQNKDQALIATTRELVVADLAGGRILARMDTKEQVRNIGVRANG
jgi:hypothetical protein